MPLGEVNREGRKRKILKNRLSVKTVRKFSCLGSRCGSKHRNKIEDEATDAMEEKKRSFGGK